MPLVQYPAAVRGWACVLPLKDSWAREVGLLSLTSAAKSSKSDVKYVHICSHRGVGWRFMQLCIKSGRFDAMKKHCLETLFLSREFSGYCESLCSNLLEQIWKIVHQRAPRTIWPCRWLNIDMHHCMFVYCRSEENHGFISCCCTKIWTLPKLKTFFHWYVFYLLDFQQLTCMARET